MSTSTETSSTSDSPQSSSEGKISTVGCPKCATSHRLEGGRSTRTLVCSTCKSILHLKGGTAKVVQVKRAIIKPSQPISLNTKVRLNGKQCKVIGWVRYKGYGGGEEWEWDEWQMLTDQGEERWLSYSKDEGFVFAKRVQPTQSFNFRNVRRIPVPGGGFDVTERYPVKIVGLDGELNWYTQAGHQIDVAEGQRGRTRFTVELDSDKSITIYEGRQLSSEKVWSALGRMDLVQKEQPEANNQNSSILMVGIAAIATLLSLLSCFIFSFSGEVIHSSTVALRTGPENYRSTEPFIIPSAGRASQVEISINDLPVNNWAVVDVSIYDEEDGEYYLFSEEFWDEEGYDDGYWRERDYHGSYLFRAPYDGKYELELLMEEATVSELTVNVKVTHGMWLVRYFLIASLISGALALATYHMMP